MAKPNRYLFGTKAKRSQAKRLAFLFCVALLCATLLVPILKERFSFESHDEGQEPHATLSQSGESCEAENTGPVIDVSKGVVQPGDTVSNILGQYFGPSDIHTLVQKCADVFPLSRINAGREYSIISEDNTFRSFVYDIDAEEQLIIEHAEDGFVVNRVPIEYETQTVTVRGTISDSLFQAVEGSGEGASLVFAIAGIYEWDIDFTRDLRQGDSFSLVVEKRYREGAFAGYGKVLAARFDNQGTPFYAILFEESEGRPSYFNLEGRSMRKAFLKAPLKFTRISSGYNLRRVHPILNEVRAHPAIDYAAPTGTPVRTIGDGTVTYAGYNGAAGNMIKVLHRNGYETWYLHLQGYARGVRKGTRVSQGQIIGYVGSTGRSTGPHLDFRMRLNGKYVNPMNVKMPPAENVSKARMDAFERTVRHLRPLLDAEEPLRVQTPVRPPEKDPTAL
ncbi:Peptidase M23 [Alkalidesulfovibrio alkalitolerans DSM 16529]|jgi:murein DD-endopeptidase MepM/ murein hydrolase activator NlpD|uniref:Peptidase M23 n=1 Tax=Alkalidesulfovibrio alkalitolerans DSM 16529 TaxID=1121439 RepID=S7T4L0_9BACT|nr:Peptidase M23 [Alkalidesulfovibrio alkalitolerans DSM 16529]